MYIKTKKQLMFPGYNGAQSFYAIPAFLDKQTLSVKSKLTKKIDFKEK